MTQTMQNELATVWEESPLHSALRLGSLAELDAASTLGPTAHAHDALGWTPLHLAAVLDLDEALAWLLANGAMIDVLSHDGRTALGLAAAAGSARSVRTLLAAGASLVVPGEARAALADASTGANLEVVQALASAGATTSEHVPYLVMALRLTGHSVWFGEKGYARGMDEQEDVWFVDRAMSLPWSLLTPIGRRPEIVDGQPSLGDWVAGRSTMVWAGFARFEVAAETHGSAFLPPPGGPGFHGSPSVSLTFRSARLGEALMTEAMLIDVLDQKAPGLSLPRALPALIRVAQLDPASIATQAPAVARKMFDRTITQAAPELLEALLEAGISPNLRDSSDRTPLMIAAGWGLGPAVDTLLKHGADPGLRDNEGRTAADIALLVQKFDLARRLGFKGERPADDRSPLHHAALKRDDTLRELLAGGANVRAVDAKGRTPLHNACQTSDDHVRLLLDAGADPNARDSSQKTPLHYAVALGFGSAPLIEAGANVNAQDASGHTPLHHAVHLNKRERATELLGAGADPRIGDSTGETPFDHFDPRLGTGILDDMWLADAQQHGPDRLGSHLKTLIDEDQYLRIQMVLNPGQVASRYSAVVTRGRLPLHQWTALAAELTDHCVSRGAWPSLHALHTSGLPVTLPEALGSQPWLRHGVHACPPGETPIALLWAAINGGAGVPFLLKLDPEGCAPALDAATFALCGFSRRDSSIDGNEAATQTLMVAMRALIDAGASVETRQGEAAARLHTAMHLPRTDADEMLWDDERAFGKRYLGLPGAGATLARSIHFTPLLQVAAACSPLLGALIEAGADLGAADRFGRNALHVACATGPAGRGEEVMVRELLAAGFAVDERSADGWRALTLTSNRAIAAILIEHGASPTLDDDERRRLGSDGVRNVERMIAGVQPGDEALPRG